MSTKVRNKPCSSVRNCIFIAGLVQVRNCRDGGRRDRRHSVRLHPQRPRLRHVHQPVLGRRLQEGLLPLDLPLAQVLLLNIHN